MESHSWGNYFVCAYKGVHELLASKQVQAPEPCGLQIMLHGTVPLGARCGRRVQGESGRRGDELDAKGARCVCGGCRGSGGAWRHAAHAR